ncbi:hypothetical protein [Micromonospora sp. LOL_021]|uniref:MmyB family transcriptional regulator n=1 Tax=Micromonospora sp. LOL_021 TaxID=3345417 RepID=UPI003A86E8EF
MVDRVQVPATRRRLRESSRGRRSPYEEMGAGSAEFRRLWQRNDVRGKTHEAKSFRHRVVGELTLTYHAFDVRGARGRQLIVYRAEPSSRSAEALRLLGSLAVSDWLS